MSTPSEDLDASTTTSDKSLPDRTEQPYDSRPGEDGARRSIAYALLAILAFVVIGAFLSFWGGPAGQADTLIKFIQALLGPIVPLVSAATGFYYGSKINGRDNHVS